MLPWSIRQISRPSLLWQTNRCLSTLANNPHIYVLPSGTSYLLSLLPTEPPTESLAIGRTSEVPPTLESFKDNSRFLSILQSVLREYAASDPQVQSQAAAFASTSGSALGSGGMFFPRQHKGRRGLVGGDGAGGASSQGGAGGGGRGGWVHISDTRAPPDYGRIAWPEDIFGSLEVDGSGQFVQNEDGAGRGRYQQSGTYRIITREGILGLSDFLRGKLVERLQKEEQKLQT